MLHIFKHQCVPCTCNRKRKEKKINIHVLVRHTVLAEFQNLSINRKYYEMNEQVKNNSSERKNVHRAQHGAFWGYVNFWPHGYRKTALNFEREKIAKLLVHSIANTRTKSILFAAMPKISVRVGKKIIVLSHSEVAFQNHVFFYQEKSTYFTFSTPLIFNSIAFMNLFTRTIGESNKSGSNDWIFYFHTIPNGWTSIGVKMKSTYRMFRFF